MNAAATQQQSTPAPARREFATSTIAHASFAFCADLYAAHGGEIRYLAPLLAHFRDYRIDEIDQAAIENAAIKLYPYAAESTRNRRVFTVISAVQKHAAMHGLCRYRRIARPRCPSTQTLLPSQAALDAFIHACSPHLRRIVIFLLYTGATVRQTLRLRWDDVDLDRSVFRTAGDRIEQSPERRLHDRVARTLKEMTHRDGAVFRRPDGRMYRPSDHGGQLKSAFRGACHRAGVGPITPRTLYRVWRERAASSNGECSDAA